MDTILFIADLIAVLLVCNFYSKKDDSDKLRNSEKDDA